MPYVRIFNTIYWPGSPFVTAKNSANDQTGINFTLKKVKFINFFPDIAPSMNI